MNKDNLLSALLGTTLLLMFCGAGYFLGSSSGKNNQDDYINIKINKEPESRLTWINGENDKESKKGRIRVWPFVDIEYDDMIKDE